MLAPPPGRDDASEDESLSTPGGAKSATAVTTLSPDSLSARRVDRRSDRAQRADPRIRIAPMTRSAHRPGG
jgi:hypothetical protein